MGAKINFIEDLNLIPGFSINLAVSIKASSPILTKKKNMSVSSFARSGIYKDGSNGFGSESLAAVLHGRGFCVSHTNLHSLIICSRTSEYTTTYIPFLVNTPNGSSDD